MSASLEGNEVVLSPRLEKRRQHLLNELLFFMLEHHIDYCHLVARNKDLARVLTLEVTIKEGE